MKSAARATSTTYGYADIPALKIASSVKKTPDGGAPVTASTAARNAIAENGTVERAPRTFAIFVELYFRKKLPAEKKSTGFRSAW